MASPIALGSYQRYKDDTTLFLEWLAKNAAASGCTLPSKKTFDTALPISVPAAPPSYNSDSRSHAEKLREKSAKKALKREEKKSQSVPNPTSPSGQGSGKTTCTNVAKTTSQVLRQAGAIANNAKVQVPEDIVKVVVRAIRTRKCFAEWFSSSKIKNEHSDDGHRYFIWILEEALRILKPRIPIPPVQESGSKSKTSPTTSPIHDVTNRFQHLLSGDVDQEEFEDAEEIGDILERASDKTSNTEFKHEKRDEVLDDQDAVFAVYCFFQDLHVIQEFLGDTWRLYGKQEIDLITASFITNAAMDIVKREEIALSSQVFPDEEKVHWLDFVAMISTKEEFQDFGGMLRISQHGSFIYESVAFMLGRHMRDFRNTPFVGMLPPFQWYYQDHPHLIGLPETDILEAESEFLAKMLLDSIHIENERGRYNQHPVSDEMWRGVWGDNKIPDLFTQRMQDMVLNKVDGTDVSTIFACRILLDIQSILGQIVVDCHTQLEKAIDVAEDALNLNTTALSRDETLTNMMLAKQIVGTGRTALIDRATAVLHKELAVDLAKHDLAAVALSDSWKALDSSDRRKKLFGLISRVWDRKSISPHDLMMKYHLVLKDAQLTPILMPVEAFARGRFNPIHCGEGLLELNLKVERMRLDFTNQGWSILVIAHLYNAARQYGKLGLGFKWLEMDKMIGIHMKTLFAGELPDDEEKCNNRLALRLGFQPQVYLPQFQEKNKDKWINRAPKHSEVLRRDYQKDNYLPSSKVAPILRRLYYDKEPISMEKCLFQLDQELFKVPSKKSNFRAGPDLTTVQFLRRLRDSLPAEIEKIQLDYMTLERKCRQLLRRIRLTCLVELNHECAGQKGPMAGANGVLAVSILKEGVQSKATMRSASKQFGNREDWRAFTEEMKVDFVRDSMEKSGFPICDQPGTPRQDIVARILRNFVEEESKSC